MQKQAVEPTAVEPKAVVEPSVEDTFEEKPMEHYYTVQNNQIFQNNFTSSNREMIVEIPDMNAPRLIYTRSDQVYVIGGKDTNDKVSGKCYHVINKDLQEVQSMKRPRISFGSFVNDEYIYIAGGMNSENKAVDNVDKYALKDGHNVQANNWYEMPSLPDALFNVSIHIFSTYNMVAAGGMNQQFKC